MRGLSLPNVRHALAAAGMAAGLVLFALVFAAFTRDQPVLAAAVPAVLGTAVLCARWPAGTVAVVLFFSAAFGSLQAFGLFSPGPLVDLLLAGLWVSVLVSALVRDRDRPWWIWPGMAIACLYILITFLEITTATSVSLGFKSFQYATWYMMTLPLLAFAGWRLSTYLRISRALIALTLLVAGYAVLRLLIGPSSGERLFALQSAGLFTTIDGELSLIGSFPSRHSLAFWVACAAPFCLAAALIQRGAWRIAAGVAIGLCLAAAYGTDVRAALPAIVGGGVTVIVLNQISQGVRGKAITQTLVAVGLAAVAGVALFTTVVGSDSDRYGAILSPSGDPSYEQHIGKWGEVLDQLEGDPFGKGLGTAGRVAEQGVAPYLTVGSYNIDNTYLKIAFEQGFPILALFMLAMIAMLIELGRRAIRTRSPELRALAIGAAGTTVAALALFVTGQYMEELSALILWVVLGSAIGAINAERTEALRASRRAKPTSLRVEAGPPPS